MDAKEEDAPIPVIPGIAIEPRESTLADEIKPSASPSFSRNDASGKPGRQVFILDRPVAGAPSAPA
jgi:hypothetical protein